MSPLRGAACGLALALPLTVAGAASAQSGQTPVHGEARRYNQVDVSAEASREVPNDLANAMVYVEVNDPSAAAVAAQVTRIANDALHTAQAQPGVRARSGGVSTVPVYASNPPGKITGWRGRSELRLESADMRAMSDLLGKLQATMSVGYVNFLVSPEARRQAENELITQAIESFRARADIVRAAIGGKSVRIRHMAVVTGMSGPAPRPFIARAAAASVTPVEPPQFEAGESRVQATVTGTVEID